MLHSSLEILECTTLIPNPWLICILGPGFEDADHSKPQSIDSQQ